MTSQARLQLNRISLLRRASLLAAAVLLIFCMSVYVAAVPEKLTIVLIVGLLAALGKRIWDRAVIPLLALVIYDMVITIVFPGAKPGLDMAMEFPLFSLASLLLCTLCLQHRSLRAQYFVMFGILGISLVGAAGDLTGHDMTALLPFSTPNESYFDSVTMDGDMERIRGFFPESGVLGATALTTATTAALGAGALLATGRRRRMSLMILIGSTFIGLTFLGATVTKSGAMALGTALFGFLVAFAMSKRPSHRALAIGGAAFAVAATLLLLAAPGVVSSYLKGEIGTFLNIAEANASGLTAKGGMITRIECWKLALSCVRYYPCGVGAYGHGAVLLKDTPVRLTSEMRFFFDRDIFGLKNALANIMAETGLVGLGILAFWLWTNLLSPAMQLLKTNQPGSVPLAGLYIASALCALAFLFSCELYPCLALLLLLKYHADAVGHEWSKAMAYAEEPVEEPGELLDAVSQLSPGTT